MEQLTEMDSSFLQQEGPRTPMHISPVIIYDQSSRKGGKVRFKEILTVFARNLHKTTVFRRKLAGGALGMDTPYWVEDPDFDLEFHVRHIALPKPGDWRQFCILLARLQARGLDMTRPLWEAYVIEGLNDVEGLPENSFAIMLKVHHAAIDGVSGAEIVTAIHSLSEEVEPPRVTDQWQGEADPGAWHVWSRAYWHNIQRPVKFASKVRELVPAFIRANRVSADNDTPIKAPSLRTRFNGRVDTSRVTDTLIMELADIKRIRKASEGATVNDVIVAIVGGALRRYLADKDELPESGSLLCTAPISLRGKDTEGASGNQVSQMAISLGTDITDPLQRLQAVMQSASSSKAYSAALGTSVIMDVSEVMIPQVMGLGMRAASYAAASSNIPVPYHVVISNVPGPQETLYLAGARLSLLMGLGPLLDMMGLFHAVLSGAGRITINFVSCRSMLPDPEAYRACLQASFEELLAAVEE